MSGRAVELEVLELERVAGNRGSGLSITPDVRVRTGPHGRRGDSADRSLSSGIGLSHTFHPFHRCTAVTRIVSSLQSHSAALD